VGADGDVDFQPRVQVFAEHLDDAPLGPQPLSGYWVISAVTIWPFFAPPFIFGGIRMSWLMRALSGSTTPMPLSSW
jgi:hypothetical protein